MHLGKTILSLFLLFQPFAAVNIGAQSGLDARHFSRHWRVESESPDYRVSFQGDTCELLAPKGLTLWRREQLHADCAVEYDVQVVAQRMVLPDDVSGRDTFRLSDMNCFWMASDPQRADIWQRMSWRSGVFARCYSLQMYYLGYGGNYNTTTRFRRYTGDERGVDSTTFRPPVLTEYTDAAHLLKPGHWYHVKLLTAGGRTQMFIDGERIVDYLDPEPLSAGWFGFRTTFSLTRIAHFSTYTLPQPSAREGIPLHWVGAQPTDSLPVTFGVPLPQGQLHDVYSTPTTDAWVNARWPDGSVKWVGIATLAPPEDHQMLKLNRPASKARLMDVRQTGTQVIVNTGRLQAYLPLAGGRAIVDSLLVDDIRVADGAWLTGTCGADSLTSLVETVTLERVGTVSAVVRLQGRHQSASGRLWLPFTLRLYFWKGSEMVKLVHTFVYDGDEHRDMLSSLGVSFSVPMRMAPYNRHVAFATDKGGVWAEPVQPLDGRRPLSDRQAQQRQMDGQRVSVRETLSDRELVDHWAAWDGFRLSQLTDNSFSIRKKATDGSPWIGTFTGCRAPGYVFVGDTEGGLAVGMSDFWQSYPSTIRIDHARSQAARLTLFMWSPEAEPMNLCHYDTIAHGLMASYEDVQDGLSTPYGIGRTTTLWLCPQTGCPSRKAVSRQAALLSEVPRLLPTPAYLHRQRAFGLWSLPDSAHEAVEQRLARYLDYYCNAVEQHKWYGFWNYGDLMHAYDPERHSWRYDVGGYAWDNTELATPMWLWYSFLRTGRADVWRMAEAMTRHNSEVDTYHLGPLAPLGSRHNVSHWGCGAKEARISQSAFLRFYYYLTGGDERTGDLMHAQTDADTLLLHLDPMRLAEPRGADYPCTAPARLRLGPDWLAYVGNWMTEWERTGNTRYRDKILAGMESIGALSDGFFTGNKALGYYPETGRITYEGPAGRLNTNHLATIMGGFEVMSELLPLLSARVPAFSSAWLDLSLRYKQMALSVSGNHFPVRRLQAYGAWLTRSPQRAAEAWDDLWSRIEHDEAPPLRISRVAPPSVPSPIDEWKGLSTNDAALWSLDAIYMLETIGSFSQPSRQP